MQYKDSVHLPF